MMQADLTELLVVSRLIPRLIWSVSATRPVVIARDENLLRLYWRVGNDSDEILQKAH